MAAKNLESALESALESVADSTNLQSVSESRMESVLESTPDSANSKPKKLVYIETLGCAMNERDSAHLLGELSAKENYKETADPTNADLILINTCSVREKPEQKLFSEIGALARSKKPGAKIGICGCTASHLGEQIIKRSKGAVSFVLGARNVSKISQIIHQEGAVEVDIDYDDSAYVFDLPPNLAPEKIAKNPANQNTNKNADSTSANPNPSSNFNAKAQLNISIGCDKKCSYCIVPFTRGKEISIPLNLLVDEAEKLAKSGVKELLLLGQNVNNYGRRFSAAHEKINFTGLLRRLSSIEGIERIRFTSPHPLHMDDEFLEEFASNPKIAKSIHMPLQSGSTRILEQMKRGYTKEWFLERVKKLKSLCPEVAIGTDIIVAFPGESDADFEETMEVLESVRFDTMYSFIYSPRPHTSAFSLPDSLLVPKDIAKARLKKLQERHKEILVEIAKSELGKVHSVMIENRYDDGALRFSEGRSSTNRLIKIPDEFLPLGAFFNITITSHHNGSLSGKLA